MAERISFGAMHDRASTDAFSIPFFFADVVLKPEKFHERFLLPWGCNLLLFEVHQTPLICVDDEFDMLKIGPPRLGQK